MPNIYRFLIKTLCVFGVLFTLTLPHNNAWGGSSTCCECYGSDLPDTNGCKAVSEDSGCSNVGEEIYKNCYDGDQYWCLVTLKGTPQCADNLETTMGFCPSGWTCKTSTNPGTGNTDESDCPAECLDQHFVNDGYSTPHCEFYGIGSDVVPKNYTFNWEYMNGQPGEGCIRTAEKDKLYSANCKTEDLYYQVGSDVDCEIKFASSQWWVGTCHGCSTEPCYNCDDTTDGFWVNGCSYLPEEYQTQYPRKVITCDKPETCGYTDPADPMYQKIKDAPNVYVRVKEYSFGKNDNNDNGSCTTSWVDIDCALGYYYITATQTCEPCPIGYTGETVSKNGLDGPYIYWKATCIPCSTGESTFSTKTIDGKTVIDKLLNAQDGDTTSCQKCPKGYIWEKYTDTSLPDFQETYICTLCSSGTYNDTEGATDCKNCSDIVKKGDSPFTSDTPNPSKGLINDSVQMCYIDPNIKLSDKLGSIYLYEEIGSGTKLYHQ